jgi:hypothetical protein
MVLGCSCSAFSGRLSGSEKGKIQASMGDRSARKSAVLAMALIAGCETTTLQNTTGARLLTGVEMDRITAGSVVAIGEATAYALGSAPQTAVSATTNSAPSLFAGAPVLELASSQAAGFASGSELAKAGLSSHVSVVGAGGGARVDASGAASSTGNDTGRAQVRTQSYGVTTNRADLVFGSIAAVACCGSGATAQVRVDGGAGGLYSRELRDAHMSIGAGQIQSSVDFALISSALPIADPAQIAVTGGPPRISPKY